MRILQMSKTVIKNLFSRPSTILYPKEPAKRFDGTRGHIENEINRCIFCGSCQRKCPAAAIRVDRRARTWEIDRFRCVACGCCVEVCPVKCLHMDTEYIRSTPEPGIKTLLKSDRPAPAPVRPQQAKPAPPQKKKAGRALRRTRTKRRASKKKKA